MLKILKAEIEYNKTLLVVMLLLPLSFTIFALNDVKLFPQIYFLKKYFWSMVIGLGTYFLVYVIWTVRKKEFRDSLTEQNCIMIFYESCPKGFEDLQ